MTKDETTRLATCEAKLDLIIENHLPHIQKLIYIALGSIGTLTLGVMGLIIALITRLI